MSQAEFWPSPHQRREIQPEIISKSSSIFNKEHQMYQKKIVNKTRIPFLARLTDRVRRAAVSDIYNDDNPDGAKISAASPVQTILLPAYTKTVYLSGLPAQPSGFTIDQTTRTILRNQMRWEVLS
jgi:hypothetical protein